MSQKQQEYRALVRSELKKDRDHGMQNASRIWRERKMGTRRNPSGGALLKWGAIGGALYLLAKHFGGAPATPPAGQLGVTTGSATSSPPPLPNTPAQRTGGI